MTSEQDAPELTTEDLVAKLRKPDLWRADGVGWYCGEGVINPPFLAADRITALQAENDRLREALTPSGATKWAYSGEFKITEELTDEEGDSEPYTFDVPWTTIKEIMAAIRDRAALQADKGGAE